MRTNLTSKGKLLEQGPIQSGCFLVLLGWSVGRHAFLRSRWNHFPLDQVFLHQSKRALPFQEKKP